MCDLVKNAGVTDSEFLKILQTLPNSCELCIRYKKTEPKPIVGNFNMASETSGSNSGISKKSLYKPAPKERIKAKRTNRKPLAQSQLVDLNNPTSAKICKNGMKSLPTLECNFYLLMFIEEKQFVLQEKDLFLVDNMMLKLMTN